MCNCSIDVSQQEDDAREQSEASSIAINTLLVLLAIAFVVGWLTSQYGLAFYVALAILWIPTTLVVGGIHLKLKEMRAAKN